MEKKLKKDNLCCEKNNFSHERLIEENKIFGFWIYLMSDIVLFASLFSTYLVLNIQSIHGLYERKIFNSFSTFIETIFLLISSFIIGIIDFSKNRMRKNKIIFLLSLTFFFGFLFLMMEQIEFRSILSNFKIDSVLSSILVLLGTHFFHIFAGMIWILVLIVQTLREESINKTRIQCLKLFWHFLDIVWVFLFNNVCLFGSL